MAKWVDTLEGVKVGDEFMVYEGRYSNTNAVIVKCERLTPKQAIVGGRSYWIKDAVPVGRSVDRWSSLPRLYVVDQKELERTKFNMRKRHVCAFKFSELSDEDIEKVYTIIYQHALRENLKQEKAKS